MIGRGKPRPYYGWTLVAALGLTTIVSYGTTQYLFGVLLVPIQRETGWEPAMSFDRGPPLTVDWYREYQDWVQRVKSGEYQTYYARNYENRDVAQGHALFSKP